MWVSENVNRITNSCLHTPFNYPQNQPFLQLICNVLKARKYLDCLVQFLLALLVAIWSNLIAGSHKMSRAHVWNYFVLAVVVLWSEWVIWLQLWLRPRSFMVLGLFNRKYTTNMPICHYSHVMRCILPWFHSWMGYHHRYVQKTVYNLDYRPPENSLQQVFSTVSVTLSFFRL